MRIFSNPYEAVREVERELFEMGIDVHPQTMQNKDVADNEDFKTKEINAYGYKLTKYAWDNVDEISVIDYLFPDVAKGTEICMYIAKEHDERWSGEMMNPGTSYLEREKTWNQFLITRLDTGEQKFDYTYSERFACQIHKITNELIKRPDTRQAVMTIHSNINVLNQGPGANIVEPSQDYRNMGGKGRIPCSMYYQFMIRDGRLNLIYTMRSCDFLTHFTVDMMLALRAQKLIAEHLKIECGDFTHFIGSLHAYKKDMDAREIF